MVKKLLIAIILVMLVFPAAAFADTGRTVMDNTIYGGIIGGLLGSAWYLLDQDEFGDKLATGVGLGLIGGFFLGLTDVNNFVEIEDGEMRAGIPTIYVTQSERYGTVFSAGLLSIKY